MPIKIIVLVTVLSSQIAIAILAMQLGGGALGWVGCAAVVITSLVVLQLFIKKNLVIPLEKLRATIQAVKMEGNLALRASSNGATLNTAKTFNELLDNFQSIIGKVIFNSSQVATSAQSLEGMARQVRPLKK